MVHGSYRTLAHVAARLVPLRRLRSALAFLQVSLSSATQRKTTTTTPPKPVLLVFANSVNMPGMYQNQVYQEKATTAPGGWRLTINSGSAQ